MGTVESPKKLSYKGLAMQYLEGGKDKPIAVIAKGLGIPGKEFGWMYTLNKLGFNVAYAPYRGTWLSEGKFLPKAEGELSVTEDISDVVEFALRKFGKKSISRFGTNDVYIVADCFGCSPSLLASTRFPEVVKVFIYGGMIYTNDEQKNAKYRQSGDKTDKLGEALHVSKTEGGNLFNGYNEFSIDVWKQMMEGNTGLNPYLRLPELSQKKIFAVHAENDNLIRYERTTDFIKALNDYCRANGLKPQTILRIVPGKKGHRGGFGTKEELNTMQFLTERGLITLAPSLIGIKRFVKEHKHGVQRPDETWFGVPFYDIVVRQVKEFKQAGLLKDKPLEEILSAIF